MDGEVPDMCCPIPQGSYHFAVRGDESDGLRIRPRMRLTSSPHLLVNDSMVRRKIHRAATHDGTDEIDGGAFFKEELLRTQVDTMNTYYDQIDEIDRHSTLWDLTKIEKSDKDNHEKAINEENSEKSDKQNTE